MKSTTLLKATTITYDNNNLIQQSNMILTPYANEDATSPLSNDETFKNNSSTKKLVSKRRSQVKNACVNCQKACKKCDEGRPCQRCIKLGITDTCFDSPRKERKKGFKRGPYRKKSTTTQPNIVPKKVPEITSPLFTTTVVKTENEPLASLTINTTTISPSPIFQNSNRYSMSSIDTYYDFSSNDNNFEDTNTLQHHQFMSTNNNNIDYSIMDNTPSTTSTIQNNYYNPTLNTIYQPYQNSNDYYYYNNYYDNTTTTSSPEDSFTTANLPNWSYTDLIDNPLYNHTQNTSSFVPKLGDNAMITPNYKLQNYENSNKYDMIDRNNTPIFNDQQWLTNVSSEMYYPSNVMY